MTFQSPALPSQAIDETQTFMNYFLTFQKETTLSKVCHISLSLEAFVFRTCHHQITAVRYNGRFSFKGACTFQKIIFAFTPTSLVGSPTYVPTLRTGASRLISSPTAFHSYIRNYRAREEDDRIRYSKCDTDHDTSS